MYDAGRDEVLVSRAMGLRLAVDSQLYMSFQDRAPLSFVTMGRYLYVFNLTESESRRRGAIRLW